MHGLGRARGVICALRHGAPGGARHGRFGFPAVRADGLGQDGSQILLVLVAQLGDGVEARATAAATHAPARRPQIAGVQPEHRPA